MTNNVIQFPLVKRLEMKHFRCFTKKIITFENAIACIQGNNGIGKTSILEALYYSCYLKSFRTTSPKEMIQFGQDHFFIKIDVISTENGVSFTQSVQIGFDDGKRRVRVDGKPIHSYKDLMAVLRVISLTEDDMFLIKGAPQERRTFLDHAIILENSDYAHQLALLRQIILTRNNLLKAGCPINSANYRIITEQLWDQSRIIQKERINYIAVLEKEVSHILSHVFKNELAIQFTYISKKEMYDTFELFMDSHKTLLNTESYLQRTCFGAQLDDVLIAYNATESRQFASRGQQKLTLLLIKIAQILLLQKKGYRSAVVFLLDDFMTDFDDSRAHTLFEILQNLNVQLVFTSPSAVSIINNKIADPEGRFSKVSL